MRARSDEALIGVVIYEGVEPIDIGGTVGVVSMARRILPGIASLTIAAAKGPVVMASGLTVMAEHGFEDAPACDCYIVTGGPGWRRQTTDPQMLGFLRAQPVARLASVCTGALILAAAGALRGRQATTRRNPAGAEAQSPLAEITAFASDAAPQVAAIVDDRGLVTSGGVSLAIDGTLFLIGRLYGEAAREEVARLIEYDRAFAANRAALGHVVV